MSQIFKIVKAELKHREAIHNFITKLADFEGVSHLLKATPESLDRHIFSTNPLAHALVAQLGELAIGFALYHTSYSTITGQGGIHLVDLYIEEEYRQRGFATKLLQNLANITLENNMERMEWWVLDWNPAKTFYEKIGATIMSDIQICRLQGKELEELAQRDKII